MRSGISLTSYHGAFCRYSHGHRHAIRAEELARWLNGPWARPTLIGQSEISRRNRRGIQKSTHNYFGRRGIVLFRNFYGSGNQGDHIDLWNGIEIALGRPDYFTRSQEIWFWEMR
jgi:hypothetical protein